MSHLLVGILNLMNCNIPLLKAVTHENSSGNQSGMYV